MAKSKSKGNGKSMGKAGGAYHPCYETHPALQILSSLPAVYGGSCSRPIITDADLYVGFDHGMKFTQRHWPWKKGNEILFPITDRSVPKDIDQFKKLIEYVAKLMQDGLKVHAGCIGGHGRTGLFYTALVRHFDVTKDAIQYVREHYCKKVVESTEQVKWLMEHFGCSAADPSKKSIPATSHAVGYAGNKGSWEDYDVLPGGTVAYGGERWPVPRERPVFGRGVSKDVNDLVRPAYSETNVWGRNIEDEVEQ